MAFRVSDAAIGKADLSRHPGSRAHARVADHGGRARAGSNRGDRAQDRTLTRTVILSSVALSCLVLAAGGMLLFGRAQDPGSIRSYTASNKALKIALVEPAAQAQMEPMSVAKATPSGPDVRVKTAAVHATVPAANVQTAAAKVPLPRAKPRAMLAAARQKERVAEKAPELPAPVVVGAASIEANARVALVDPPPQPSPTRGEGVVLVSASPRSEVDAELQTDAASADVTNVASDTTSKIKLTSAAPVPATFGPARPAMAPFQLTSYAPTRDIVFGNDITGSIGNPLRDPGKFIAEEQKPQVDAAPLPAKLAAIAPPKPVLKKPRVLTVQEKLWGSPVRVASLAPVENLRETNIAARGNIPTMPYDRQTAVYVITHKKVYLPDGTELEAHSGYGQYMDDPRFAHLRMRGVTPPHVYNLKMREALFHGVEAIRMLPIGGSGEIFGRDGILAHTYLLGRTGQSHGCVSFKDYDTFLEAFKDGKINKIAVLAKLD